MTALIRSCAPAAMIGRNSIATAPCVSVVAAST